MDHRDPGVGQAHARVEFFQGRIVPSSDFAQEDLRQDLARELHRRLVRQLLDVVNRHHAAKDHGNVDDVSARLLCLFPLFVPHRSVREADEVMLLDHLLQAGRRTRGMILDLDRVLFEILVLPFIHHEEHDGSAAHGHAGVRRLAVAPQKYSRRKIDEEAQDVPARTMIEILPAENPLIPFSTGKLPIKELRGRVGTPPEGPGHGEHVQRGNEIAKINDTTPRDESR